MPLTTGNLDGTSVKDYELLNGTATVNVKFSVGAIAGNVTGTQASGTQIPPSAANVTVSSAGVAYSVTLPPAVPGLEIDVVSITATNTIAVFPSPGNSINALSANAALVYAALTSTTFICVTAGQWYTSPRVPS